MKKKQVEKKVVTKIANKKLVKEKHSQIINVASKLFSKKGYHSTTMRDISEASGIHLSYLYNYVSSKDDILYLFYLKIHEDIDSFYQKLENSNNEDPIEEIKNFIKSFLEYTHRKKGKMLTIYTESRHLNRDSLHAVLSIESQRVKTIEKFISKGIQKGCFKTDSPHMASNIIQYLLLIEPLRAWNFRHEYTFTLFSALITDFILNALGVEGKNQVENDWE